MGYFFMLEGDFHFMLHIYFLGKVEFVSRLPFNSNLQIVGPYIEITTCLIPNHYSTKWS